MGMAFFSENPYSGCSALFLSGVLMLAGFERLISNEEPAGEERRNG